MQASKRAHCIAARWSCGQTLEKFFADFLVFPVAIFLFAWLTCGAEKNRRTRAPDQAIRGQRLEDGRTSPHPLGTLPDEAVRGQPCKAIDSLN